MFYVNVQGLVSKLLFVYDLLHNDNPDVLCISESWLCKDVSDAEIQMPGYVTLRKDRNLEYFDNLYTQESRGGVMAYVKCDLHPIVSDMNDTPSEFLWFNISPSVASDLLVGVCYRSELAGEQCVNTICDSLDKINTTNSLIVGDFNFRDINWTSLEAFSPISTKFLNTVLDNYLQQLVDVPTRMNYINDLVLTGNPTIIDAVNVSNLLPRTDHKTISIEVKLYSPKIVRAERKVYLYSKGRYADFDVAVANIEWDNVLSSRMSIEQQWIVFKNTYFDLLDKYVPSKMVKPGSVLKFPWLNNRKLNNLNKKRKSAKAKASQSGLNCDRYKQQAADDNYFEHLKKCKYAYETKVASKIKENPRGFYNYCRKFSRTASTIDCLNVNGSRITDDRQKAEALNDFFAKVMITEDDNVPYFQSHEDTTRGLYDIQFSPSEVFETMSKLKPNKGCGPDGIHPHVLREVGALSKPLYMLFRSSLDKGALPEDWRIANICALHKKGNRTEANNYRPVSLTSQVVKLFERILHKAINTYCEQNDIITCHQHGFLSRCSCLTNLLECLNDWTTAYDQPKTGIDIVYTDFRKAFDSVPPPQINTETRRIRDKRQGFEVATSIPNTAEAASGTKWQLL